MRNQFALVLETPLRSSTDPFVSGMNYHSWWDFGFRFVVYRSMWWDSARLRISENPVEFENFDISGSIYQSFGNLRCVRILWKWNSRCDRIFFFFFFSRKFNELFDRFENSIWRNLIRWIWSVTGSKIPGTWYYKFPISFYSVKLNVLGYSTL